MDVLRKGMARGKFRYVAHVLAEDLAQNSLRERVELFFQAVRAAEVSPPRLGMCLAFVFRYLRHWLHRDSPGMVRQALLWLCVAPHSRLACRILLRLCRDRESWKHLYCAAAESFGMEHLRPREQRHLCRLLIQEGQFNRVITLAKLLLEQRPDDGEARHLLWSAMLQAESWEEKRMP